MAITAKSKAFLIAAPIALSLGFFINAALVLLALEILVIEICALVLITIALWPAARVFFDGLWRSKKMLKPYTPDPGATEVVLYRTDDGITVWWYFFEEMLTLLKVGFILAVLAFGALSVYSLIDNVSSIPENGGFVALWRNPFSVLLWFFTPYQMIAVIVIVGLIALPAPILIWRLKWLWIYNFVDRWVGDVHNEELYAKWKGLLTLTPMTHPKHDSGTPLEMIHELIRATDPKDLGFPKLALNPIDRGVINPSPFEMLKFHIFEWWVGIRFAKHGTANIKIPSPQYGGQDMIEWLWHSDEFVRYTERAGAKWKEQLSRMKGIEEGGIKTFLADYTKQAWSASELNTMDLEIRRRRAQVYPQYWPEVDLYELAAQHPTGYIVVIPAPQRADQDATADELRAALRGTPENNGGTAV